MTNEHRPLGSWVIVRRSDGEAAFETFSENVANSINKAKYEALPVRQYLERLNAKIKDEKNGK